MKKKQQGKRKQTTKQKRTSDVLDRQQMLTERIATAVQTRWRLSAKQAWELGFHMTDWIEDLTALHDLMNKRRWDKRSAARVISHFLVHVPWHVTQAQKIMYREDTDDSR